MEKKSFFISNGIVKKSLHKVNGGFVNINGEKYYKIENCNNIPPFFMSIVSDSDHWMFISSNGALSAGRKNPDHSLFPYYTDDKITASADITGNLSIFFIKKKDKIFYWEPFSDKYNGLYQVTRNIYKNTTGNKIIFEEINHELEIIYKYGWFNSERFGFIKKSTLINQSKNQVSIELLDGIQNIIPYGITRVFQNIYSNLANAYKKNELCGDSKIGIYYLSSIPTDKAEPSEGLKCTTVWSTGFKKSNILLSSTQVEKFRQGETVIQEEDIRAKSGAYLLNSEIKLDPGLTQQWQVIAEVNQEINNIKKIKELIHTKKDIEKKIEQDIETGTESLKKIVANADGLQLSDDELITTRHFSNVIYNAMRGGIFNNNYYIDKTNFLNHLKKFNVKVFLKYRTIIDNLNDNIDVFYLIKTVKQLNNNDLLRICYEYLPLTFSRRHGDPSRPWNLFSIETKSEDGEKLLNYQGNWRDIFQNWEALCLSFPEFLESMICKFVNASTIDGYNPYRITNNGIDWEVINPSDPWSNIGYWGDHQIIYLQKLIELSNKFHPGKIEEFLIKNIFVYSNVPYRIKPYNKLIQNSSYTIDFDDKVHQLTLNRTNKLGADGKLYWIKNNSIYKVNLTEKILISILTKLYNFIPGGGIWLNTQRPEWNDANNALVGNGLSMVTLYYLRRALSFWIEIFKSLNIDAIKISEEIEQLFIKIYKIIKQNLSLLDKSITVKDRKLLVDLLGNAGSDYRKTIYEKGFSAIKRSITRDQIIDLFETSIQYIDHSIKTNKRNDGLYHAYNIMVMNNNEIKIKHLYEMLEGQVAILSSGYLNMDEVIEILDTLKESKIYKKDQQSYLLYPDRQLKKFMEKNIIHKEYVNNSKLIDELIKNKDQKIIYKDIDGELHFAGELRNSAKLKEALTKLDEKKYKNLIKSEEDKLLNIFEKIFDHESFTGRSGTFYGYEGLGCIYWHMVSKLLLAVQENYFKAEEQNADVKLLKKLKNHYYEIKNGLGINKTPDQYGAFPIDPYSHTPGDGGVKQPGMTGQVKEDIISRFGELGVKIKDGKIFFKPSLLRNEEFLKESKCYTFFNLDNKEQVINLSPGCLAFSFCNIPIVYKLSNTNEIDIEFNDCTIKKIESSVINREISLSIFKRNNIIKKITVNLNFK